MLSDHRPSVWWVRRDFRLADNPALRAAHDSGTAVVPLFVLDPDLLRNAGTGRRAWLMAALHALDDDLKKGGGPGLSVVEGKPANAVVRVARACGAAEVHISADFGPYGRWRDARVRKALAEHDITLTATGSPYAVAPGTLTNQSGSPFQVFTPFHRAWSERDIHEPAPALRPGTADWLAADDQAELEDPDPGLSRRAGEKPAREAWHRWVRSDEHGPADYEKLHDFPGPDATSRLSIALRWGHLHPRTILADLGQQRSKGAAALARQIAWRDFFADVLFHRPDAVSQPIKPAFAKMECDDPDSTKDTAATLDAWRRGRTGFPMVDAGMRQLLAEGWMHNRVRMITASFLIKDLHIGWWHGADWFMEHLHDGDIAQNQLNWQWVAGCGTDASPYFRVFNPISQGSKFDPDGTYIRRYVSELADIDLKYLHQPWDHPDGQPQGYPAPIVDHAAERLEALDRYEVVKNS